MKPQESEKNGTRRLIPQEGGTGLLQTGRFMTDPLTFCNSLCKIPLARCEKGRARAS